MEELFDIQNETFCPTLLLVDDEENILRSIRRILRGLNINVVMATSGPSALDILQHQEVNLIISDMRMPEMSGTEFLSQAAQNYPHVPRILMTGYSDMESTIEAINEGRISNYLPKPWDDDRLKSIVADGLQRTQLKAHNEHLTQQLIEKKAALEAMNINLEQAIANRTQDLQEKSAKLESAVARLNESHDSMVSLMSNILALRDTHGNKCCQVKAAIATDIAKELGCDDETVRSIRNATLLANLGKMAFRDKTLDKPYNTLTKTELAQFRKFPLMGEAVLLGIPEMATEACIIRSQFERYNGGGFPDGSEADSIPLGARILAVARDYIELVQGRYTGSSMDPLKARAEIRKYSNERYDPQVVSAFGKIIEHYSMGEVVQDEQSIPSRHLKSGMSLSRNVYSPEGISLLKKGVVLNEELIEKLINFEQISDSPLDIYIAQSSL